LNGRGGGGGGGGWGGGGGGGVGGGGAGRVRTGRCCVGGSAGFATCFACFLFRYSFILFVHLSCAVLATLPAAKVKQTVFHSAFSSRAHRGHGPSALGHSGPATFARLNFVGRIRPPTARPSSSTHGAGPRGAVRPRVMLQVVPRPYAQWRCPALKCPDGASDYPLDCRLAADWGSGSGVPFPDNRWQAVCPRMVGRRS